MGPDGVVVLTPLLDEYLGLLEGGEDLPVEQFIPEAGIEAFDIPVLPRRSRCDVGGLGTNGSDPVSNDPGDELGAVIRSDILWWPPQDEQIRQSIHHIGGVEPAISPKHQGLPGELVDDDQDPVWTSIMRPILDKVIGPDMVRSLRPKTDARAVIQPETAPLTLLWWDLKPFTFPDALNPLVVHMPTRLIEQRRNRPIAIAAILLGQLDDISRQAILVSSTTGSLPLRRPVLAECAAGSAFGYAKGLTYVVDASATARRAQKFPRAASVRIILSSVRSDTARRSRPFSFSNSFSRFS